MSAAASEFVDFLLADLEATEDTAFAEDLLAKAKAKITAGKGELAFMESASANGKSFNRSKELSSLQVAAACRKALDLYAHKAGSSPITFLDFRGIA